jgi:hypothetical protein
MRNLLLLSLSLLIKLSCFSQVPTAPSNGVLDGDKNWVMSKTYDANGVLIGESKSFVNNVGEVMQVQTRNMTYNHILATQPMRDAEGRVVGNTLAAPINSNGFVYRSDFMVNGSGTAYDYKNFDRYYSGFSEVDKTNNPDAVGGQSTVGTLGWYYGNNNTWEKYTPTGSYPYTRTAYLRDGSGVVKKQAGMGDVLRMGQGHEVQSYVVPVINELDFYLQVKNKYFPQLGDNGQPMTLSTLKNEATQEVAQDANGRSGVAIKDKGGKILMTARPGSGGITVRIV